jgi:hypothetical protein
MPPRHRRGSGRQRHRARGSEHAGHGNSGRTHHSTVAPMRALKVRCKACGKAGPRGAFWQWAGGWVCNSEAACGRRMVAKRVA